MRISRSKITKSIENTPWNDFPTDIKVASFIFVISTSERTVKSPKIAF